MGKNDRRNRHNHKNWNNNYNNNYNNYNKSYEQKNNVPYKARFLAEDSEDIMHREQAIRELKQKEIICTKCGERIGDITSSLSDQDGNPIHFDCALDNVKSKESLLPGQQVSYIGNGRFAVVTFENPRDLKKFKIEKIIEYEDKSKPLQWREDISELYSQVK